MKRILKNEEPSYFTAWKANFREANGREPLYSDFRETTEWQMMINTLLEEQGYICCYCMKRIEGWDSHIEHFIPRGIKNIAPHSVMAHDVELNYKNMFESCNGEHGDWTHCGRFKDNDSNPMILSPISDHIEKRFCYELDGSIDAVKSDDGDAMTTIRILNLDSAELKRHRQTAIFTALDDPDWPECKERLIEQYMGRDESGAFTPYCMAIVWVMQNLFD